MIYAIIKSGGKQIKVHAGMAIWVEKLKEQEGSKVKFTEVKAVYDGKELKVGTPNLKAEVTATVKKQGKGKKLKIFRTKEKSNWDREMGHRQPYSRVLIEDIILDGTKLAAKKAKPETEGKPNTTTKPKVAEKKEEDPVKEVIILDDTAVETEAQTKAAVKTEVDNKKSSKKLKEEIKTDVKEESTKDPVKEIIILDDKDDSVETK